MIQIMKKYGELIENSIKLLTVLWTGLWCCKPSKMYICRKL